MTRTNVLTTAKRIRRQIGNAAREEYGTLLTGLGTSDTSVVFVGGTMPAAVRPGVVLGIDTELLRVITADVTTSTCTVARGHFDSDAALHSGGAQIDINPRFTMLDILDAMISEIDSWGQELYYVDSRTFTVDTAIETFELPVDWAETLGVVDCLQSEQRTDNTVWPRLRARLIRGTAATFTGATTSGILLRLHEAIRTGSLFITVALPFNTDLMTTTADLLTDVKLSRSLLDVLEAGTRQRLVTISDDTRTGRNAQDEPRRSEETAIGALAQLSQMRTSRYLRRKHDEIARLRRLYPIRMS